MKLKEGVIRDEKLLDSDVSFLEKHLMWAEVLLFVRSRVVPVVFFLSLCFVSGFFGEEVDYSCFGLECCVVFGLWGDEVFVAFFDGFCFVVDG